MHAMVSRPDHPINDLFNFIITDHDTLRFEIAFYMYRLKFTLELSTSRLGVHMATSSKLCNFAHLMKFLY